MYGVHPRPVNRKILEYKRSTNCNISKKEFFYVVLNVCYLKKIKVTKLKVYNFIFLPAIILYWCEN
jgi:hypothetical protein